ncbi:MAG: DUF721 domain-containing protein [Parachlamydiaceae bacterium]|nr:DUF721 domain-containing protein [Parachlamydiaceae bacterium]
MVFHKLQGFSAVRKFNKFIPRTPKYYDGTRVTTHKFSDLLPVVLSQISDTYQDRPDLILSSWPEVIGSKLASMTQAISFFDGVLTVKVKNSTLHSLLSRHDKARILAALRQRFSKIYIQNIVFRIG